jgi:hypothetical protein
MNSKNITVSDAISSLRPGQQYVLCNDNYESLVWHNENELPPPTKEELLAEIQRLQAEYEYNQYQRDRAIAYPSIKDQLDTLYHQGYDGWKAAIGEVKNKYPKPGEDL